VHYLEKAFAHAKIINSYDDILSLLKAILKLHVKMKNEQKIETYIQHAVNVCEKDPFELCRCHWVLGDWYEKNGMKEKALQHYEHLLTATGRNHLSSKKILDNIWIDFVLVDRSGNFQFGPIGESSYVDSFLPMCRRHLPSLHFKEAILLWKAGALHETMKMTFAALDFYPCVTETFEKLIYKHNDTRTKQALHYLLSRHNIYANTYACCSWLKCSKLSHLAMFSAATGRDKWKCVLQRLKMLKMAHIDDQWEFHLKIEYSVLDVELCNILLNEFLQICRTETHSDENNTSLDMHSIICCLEFISHWYLNRGQLLESLLYRQCQLEIETNIFKEHPHVAWSLWFIGLIFQKMNEYDLALGYLDRALKIFESKHSKEHTDIQKLEEQISQTKQTICITHIPQANKYFMKTTDCQKINCNPKILKPSFHID
jgi:tetratricopeptide (TPR) repeat protein